MEIVWSDTALKSYLGTIDYLFEKWSLKEIDNFENKVANLLENILANNDLFLESKFVLYIICSINVIRWVKRGNFTFTFPQILPNG